MDTMKRILFILFIFNFQISILKAQEELSWNLPTSQWKAQSSGKESLKWMTALNIFTQTEVNDGNLNLLDRMWFFNSDIQGDARISIIKPTSTQITEVNSPTWTKDVGYTGNGTNMYLNTNYNPALGINYTQNNCSSGILIHSISNQASACDYGCVGAAGTGYIALYANEGSKTYIYVNTETGVINPASNLTGLYAMMRNSSTAQYFYFNGSEQWSGSSTSASISSANIYIMCINLSGGTQFTTNTYSMAFFGSGNINQLKLYNDFNTFLTNNH